jgi:hypothetical protein
MLLTQLFELYHRSNVHEGIGKGMEELVSAARTAGLCSERPISFGDDISLDLDTEWRHWCNGEERKRWGTHLFTTNYRTVFVIYILATLFASVTSPDSIGLQTTFLPSDINLTLPCDEDIYSAPSPVAWKILNSSATEMPQFSEAFHTLMHAQKSTVHTFSSGPFSMFGALVLIAAVNSEIHRQTLHNEDNYVENAAILQEKFEPVLKGWEFAWRSHPHACLSAANAAYGPLSADSVPLLNLAYVRLFADTSRTLGIGQFTGDVFPFLCKETRGMSNVAHRIRVLKAVGYAINSLYLSEWFLGIISQSSAATISSLPKRNWSFVAPFAGLESAIVVGTWLDRLVQLPFPVRDPEAKFLGRMDRVFPNSVTKRKGVEGRGIVNVWGVLNDEDVMHALPCMSSI